MRRFFWFFECLFGSRYRPNDLTTEFLRHARLDGYYYARAKAFFGGHQVRRSP